MQESTSFMYDVVSRTTEILPKERWGYGNGHTTFSRRIPLAIISIKEVTQEPLGQSATPCIDMQIQHVVASYGPKFKQLHLHGSLSVDISRSLVEKSGTHERQSYGRRKQTHLRSKKKKYSGFLTRKEVTRRSIQRRNSTLS